MAIAHPTSFFLPIRPGYVSLMDGDVCAALILAAYELRTGNHTGSAVVLTETELARMMCGAYSARRIRDRLPKLVKRGYLSPTEEWRNGLARAYRFEADRIELELTGVLMDSDGLLPQAFRSNPQPRTNDRPPRTNVQGPAALPRTNDRGTSDKRPGPYKVIENRSDFDSDRSTEPRTNVLGTPEERALIERHLKPFEAWLPPLANDPAAIDQVLKAARSRGVAVTAAASELYRVYQRLEKKAKVQGAGFEPPAHWGYFAYCISHAFENHQGGPPRSEPKAPSAPPAIPVATPPEAQRKPVDSADPPLPDFRAAIGELARSKSFGSQSR